MTVDRETCRHCGAEVPRIRMTDAAWQAVGRCLEQGRSTMAAAELAALTSVGQAEAQEAIEHFRSCVFSWPIDDKFKDAIERVDAEFLGLPKPEHFMNSDHCDECRQHDYTLCAKTVTTITRQDFGNMGYSPISFSSAEGIAYYFPALARFAVVPSLSEGQDTIFEMLGSIPSDDAAEKRFLDWCTSDQRAAVVELIDALQREGSQQDSTHNPSNDKARSP